MTLEADPPLNPQTNIFSDTMNSLHLWMEILEPSQKPPPTQKMRDQHPLPGRDLNPHFPVIWSVSYTPCNRRKAKGKLAGNMNI